MAGGDRFKVVINHEEQYSLWPVDRELPRGWRAEGAAGGRAECLRHIEEVWTDMRPPSLRKAVEQAVSKPTDREDSAVADSEAVLRLSRPGQRVEATSLMLGTPQALEKSPDCELVHLKFTGTRSETKLTFGIDREKLSVSRAEKGGGEATVHLEGELTLGDVRVRCIADIDLQTLAGTGHVEPIPR